ncbi:phenol hydroxylase [Diaporthe helianthi]|uniref:Phenol hydroxylase n=1 Tax=Diaporthe helianthi TaxID=158607 RepID=A0A2P5HN25_DIAHE|nr:phenol hydroxylase [Diaporthe helianthi]
MAAITNSHGPVPNGVGPESNIDVLIIGAGPAGLEIFDSLGFGDRAWKEANHMIEICMWNPGQDGVIRRSDRIPDTIVGLSRFQQIVLHQGRIEKFFLDNIKKYSKDSIKVERGVLPASLSIDESKLDHEDSYPVTVELQHLSEEESTPKQQMSGSKVADGLFRSTLNYEDDEHELIQHGSRAGQRETVHARYVLGCDGARSWTRGQLGFELQGEATDFIWGVMDIIPITDFPDIRMRCAIHSAEHGSLMVIPREKKLVRLYIQLKEVTPDATGRADRSKITPDLIFSAAKRILQPYKLEYEYCDWWTAYQIGQRVGTDFSSHNRIFLAGDAVHTHSPKAGQGMNVSMQDTFNLGWKIALVLKGIAKPGILSTYASERRQVAQDLIDFDHRFSRLFSGRPAKDVMDAEGVSMEEFKDAFLKGNMFASGLSVEYGASTLVANNASSQSLATGLPVGKRFNSFKVLNQADARPWHFQERLKADGRFRVVLFAGQILEAGQKARVDKFCARLDADDSFLRQLVEGKTPEVPIDSVVEVLTIHSSRRTDIELLRDFPEILHPFDKSTGWDYDKIFVDDESYHEGCGDAYKSYGVDRERGCVVVVRPDQYVAWVGEVDDFDGLQRYFEGCLRLRRESAAPKTG